jgi:hypothetical protein
MEVKNDYSNINNIKLVRVNYKGSNDNDIFLSHKSCTCTICFHYIVFYVWAFFIRIIWNSIILLWLWK